MLGIYRKVIMEERVISHTSLSHVCLLKLDTAKTLRERASKDLTATRNQEYHVPQKPKRACLFYHFAHKILYR